MKYLYLPISALLCLALCSCGKDPHSKQIFAMDTVMNLAVYSDNGGELLNEVSDMIFELDAELDRNDPNSAVSKLNENGGGTVSEDIARLIDYSSEIFYQTGGSFDITIAPLMELWGFYTKEYNVPSEDELQSALEKTGFEKLTTDGSSIRLNGTELDFGGIAKGYASGKAAAILKNGGASSAILSLGGNVYALGARPDGSPWRVAIADPNDISKSAGTLRVTDSAVITSGSYQRNFSDGQNTYHHILDPKTGKNPSNSLLSVTVIGSDPAICDALSTAFFVMGTENAAKYLSKHTELEAVFIEEGGKIFITPGIEDVFETSYVLSVIDR